MKKIIKQGLKISLLAGSLELSEVEHPNKMPFTGILTYFDRASDRPVGGAGGKKVVIPSQFGIPALASLKGMAVDFDPLMMDKHVITNKIGIIEDAYPGDRLEDGSLPVYVKGYIFAHDFSQEASDIKECQSDLGFSYETIETPVIDAVFNGESVLMVCGDVVFSGAAILLADKAAYTTTSLAAQTENTEKESETLNVEEIVAKFIESLEARFDLKAKEDKKEEEIKEDVKAEEKPAEEEAKEVPKAEEVNQEETKEEPKEEGKEEEVKADFQAMAEDLKAQVEALKAELEQAKTDLKAEAEAKFQHERKGFAYPTTLATKYNLDASADTYEAKIASIDAREDLSVEERMALKFELRDQHLKTLKR